MNLSRGYIALLAFVFFSPVIITILHDGVLCSFAPSFGIHAGDDASCTLGWNILGLMGSYVIAVALGIGVAFFSGISFWALRSSSTTRTKVSKFVLWIPLLPLLFFDGSIVHGVYSIYAANAKQKYECETARPNVAVKATPELMVVTFSHMPTRSAYYVYDAQNKPVFSDAFAQEESGTRTNTPVGMPLYKEGQYRLSVIHGTNNCEIGSTTFSIVMPPELILGRCDVKSVPKLSVLSASATGIVVKAESMPLADVEIVKTSNSEIVWTQKLGVGCGSKTLSPPIGALTPGSYYLIVTQSDVGNIITTPPFTI